MLARLLLEEPDLLVLDEPTNHPDIPAQEALEQVLLDFQGTILLVSHDRYLIERLATQVWELRDGQLEVFRGSYREYVLHRAGLSSNRSKLPGLLLSRPLASSPDRKTRKQAEALDRLEECIRQQEPAVQRLSAELQKSGPSRDFERLHQLSWQLAQAQIALDDLLAEWEKLAVS